MASRRKSTTPCMVLPSEAEEQEPEMEVVTEGEDAAGSAAVAPVEDAVVPEEHEPEPNLSLQTNEDNFTWTGFGQQVANSDCTLVQQQEPSEEDSMAMGIPISKTPIMKMKSRSESKRIAVGHKSSDGNEMMVEGDGEQEAKDSLELMNAQTGESAKPCLVINGQSAVLVEPKKAVVNSTAVLPAGLAQVLSALQVHQNSQAQLLIPVSSIPTYNLAMDSNVLLVNTYNKFPYPSVSEIMTLSAQTKFTEEQIKIWFSAQRLKHGVSWTPEEVEEARRKRFNGTVHSTPQTITVIPTQLPAVANGLQSILQTCQIMGQPGLVLAQVGGGNTLPVTAPITLAVAGVPSQAQPLKPTAAIQTTPTVMEEKRAATAQTPSLSPQESATIGADTSGLRTKKSKEQLAVLKASYMKNHFASDAEIARLMKLTGLTKGDIKKWFSDTRYNQRNSRNCNILGEGAGGGATIVIDSSDETSESPPSGPVKETRVKSRNPFPDFTLQKFKEKTPEQLLHLEESFQKCDTPTDEELSRLRAETKLTRREIDAWFTERRKASDQKMEQTDTEELKQTSPRRQGREKIEKKTPEQLHVLKSTFVRTQWPSAEEYDKLAEDSGLPRAYIVNWFGDTRYAFKNGNLKWYYYYQSGNTEAVNGRDYKKRGRGRLRSRNRGRGWTRKSRRSSSWARSPPVVKKKRGKDVLKEYYLKHKFLNEQDLDELVSKTSMSYEQVRDWFAGVAQRVEMGVDPFAEATEEKVSTAADERLGGGTAVEHKDESEDSDSWEPPRRVKKSLSENQ